MKTPKKKPLSASRIARELARQIYDIGDDTKSRAECKRVQFMLGEWPDERPMGGLCERAMVTVIAQILREMRVAE